MIKLNRENADTVQIIISQLFDEFYRPPLGQTREKIDEGWKPVIVLRDSLIAEGVDYHKGFLDSCKIYPVGTFLREE